MSENKTKVVKNASKAYGYNYSSLADMVNDGVEIPKMRIKPIEGQDYVEYFDGTEWQLGARVVVPANNKGMNEAQAYGAALTYARRYTTQMAEQVACDDDAKLETQAPKPKPQGGVRYNPAVQHGNLIVDDGKTPLTQPGSMTVNQQNYIFTLLTHEYGMEEMKAREYFQNNLKPKLTGSNEASAMIKKLQAKTPLEEL